MISLRSLRLLFVFLCVFSSMRALNSPTDANAQVSLPGTQPGDLQNWPLLKPDDCAACHGGYVADQDYEPFDTWSGSMMANSARDPLFWAAVDIANQDVPGIGEFCIRCHSPRAWLEGRSTAADGSAMLGFPDEQDNDFDGVDCHMCHRMYEGEAGTPFTENGQFWIDDGTPTQEPPRYGPYDDSFAPHPAEQSSYTTSSELCGTCHDLKNPLVELLDENGVSTGLLFPEQLTYTEWANSAFATEGVECQDCHMPDAGVDPAFACNSFTPSRPVFPGEPGVSRHDLAGANTFIPQVLKGEYGAALGREAAYDYTIARAFEMLQQHSATLEVTAPTVTAEGGAAQVGVRVTNTTGHKLPTGYPEGRRMWIHLRVTDAQGATVFESGAYDDVTATLATDPQLRIYEAKHGQDGEGPGFHLVLNNRIYFDSRIPPRGFVPVPGSEPVGVEYPVQPDGSLAHWDETTYTFEVPEGVQGPLQVAATLRYQTASREYVEFLRDENVSGPDPHDRNFPNAPSRGEKIHSFWTTYGKSAPVDMVDDAASVTVVAAPANVADLGAVSGHEQVRLSWTLPAGAVGLKLMRAAWNGYPEYASAGGSTAPAFPPSYAEALAAGWTEVYDGADATFDDTAFPGRDVWSYAAFAYDGQGAFANASSGSQLRAVNYRLGDLGEFGVPNAYDGIVDGVNDLLVFSLAYGAAEGAAGWNPEADFGPTAGENRVPTPDDVVDFADLVVFAVNFGTADPLARSLARANTATGEAQVVLGPVRAEGDTFVWPVFVDPADGDVRLVHLGLAGLDPEATVRSVTDLPAFGAVTAGDDGVSFDFAVLGASLESGMSGHVADVVVSAVAPLEVLDVDVRALDGSPRLASARVETTVDAPSTVASRMLALSRNVPNPFNPRTSLELALAREADIDVAVYDLAGRRVRTLAAGRLGAGTHTLVWDGADGSGQGVASGVYLVRAVGAGESMVRRVALVR